MIDNPFTFFDVITAYQGAAVVTAAHRLGVFAALSDEEQTSAELAATLEVDESNLEALLAALAAIGLARSGSSGYAATKFTDERLSEHGDLGLVVAKEAVFADAWLRLDEVVRSGAPTMRSWRDRLDSNPSQARSFLEALDVLARVTGPPLHELAELAPGKRVLDVGGGLGSYATRLAAAGSTVVLVDLPQVVEWAAETLPGDGIELVVADVMTDPSCGADAGSVDAALVSHMLHDLTESEGVALLRNVYRAIRPGGALVVNEFAGDKGPGAFGPMFDVMMRVETGGKAHRAASLESMIEAAGFTGVRLLPYDEPLTVFSGERP